VELIDVAEEGLKTKLPVCQNANSKNVALTSIRAVADAKQSRPERPLSKQPSALSLARLSDVFVPSTRPSVLQLSQADVSIMQGIIVHDSWANGDHGNDSVTYPK
jgi:hypothetical protein